MVGEINHVSYIRWQTMQHSMVSAYMCMKLFKNHLLFMALHHPFPSFLWVAVDFWLLHLVATVC